MSRQSGFTLVELMISLVLGLFIILAAASVLVSSLTQLSNTQSFSEILDNGRVAMAMVGKDASQAGFLGELSGQPLRVGSNITLEVGGVSSDCTGDGTNNSTYPNPNPDAVGEFRMLWGETLTGSSALGCIIDARPGTDLIQIKRLVGYQDTTATVVEANRVYMVTNSTSGIIFNGNTGLAGTPPNNSQYYEYQHRVYYIRNEPRYGQSNFPVLTRETLHVEAGKESMVKEEIAEGVEDLRILYGIDDNGDAAVDRYVTSDQVTEDEWDQADHARIVSVQISMLVRAIEIDNAFKSAGSATYTYGGKTTSASADGIRRKVLTSTFAMRNYQIANGG